MRQHFYILLPLLALTCCNTATENTEPPSLEKDLTLSGDYFGFEADTAVAVFGEGSISTGAPELNAAFSPDGNEFFYSMTNYQHSYFVLLRYVRKKGVWEGPEVAPFSGKYSDADPCFSPDGKRLYFISKRPLTDSITSPKDFDIWYVEKGNDGHWGHPTNAGETINSERNEYYVSVTKDYSLYYSTNYEDLKGPSFIHKAELVDGEYMVSKLPDAINGTRGGSDPYISPEEDMIIFSSRRSDGFGAGDLYISFKVDGQWTQAMNMGDRINSEATEYCPMLSPDKKHFFFTSFRMANNFQSPEKKDVVTYIDKLKSHDNGLGNIYWIKSDFLKSLKTKSQEQ